MKSTPFYSGCIMSEFENIHVNFRVDVDEVMIIIGTGIFWFRSPLTQHLNGTEVVAVLPGGRCV